jgi:hypothetical protein
MERISQAAQLAIQTLNLATDEDDTLSKSSTMSGLSMFRGGDNLPLIIGSQAFMTDEGLLGNLN